VGGGRRETQKESGGREGTVPATRRLCRPASVPARGPLQPGSRPSFRESAASRTGTETGGIRPRTNSRIGAEEITCLASTVWTRDLQRAHRVAAAIDSGTVWINCWLLRDLRVPFGGMRESGVGREGGFASLEFFTEAKNVCVKL